METLSLIQGSEEWLAHRSTHFNASDAPAMMGVSPYKTRSQLLQEMATGIMPEVDAATQRRFDDGHRFEALARPLAESIVGQDLYPVTGSEGKLSASFDGISMCESVIFEHKTLSDRIRAAKSASELPKDLRIQMEHQLHVSGAEKCLFMASVWDGDVLVEEIHHWYMPDFDKRARIIAAWEQFEKDLAAYAPREITEKPKAEITIELPALFVHAKGEITTHNMDEFGLALTNRMAEVRSIILVTDQDFSNAKEAAKKFRQTAKDIAISKEQMLAQTETIGEAARKMDAWSKDLNATALQLEKDVEREDMAKKTAMVNEAKVAIADHVDALHAEIKPITLNLKVPNFAEALKGKRNYASMQDAVDTALSQAKSDTDAVARDIRGKLAWFKEYANGYESLFADLQQIIYKAEDDFDALVERRIADHKKVEAEKLEVERQRIQQEEEAKAEAKVRAEQEAKAAQEREAKRVADAAESARLFDESNKAALENAEAIKARDAVGEGAGRELSEPEQAAHEKDGAQRFAEHHPSLSPADKRAAVVEHQDEVREFLATLDVSDAKKNTIRAYLVEFVKFQASRALKEAA